MIEKKPTKKKKLINFSFQSHHHTVSNQKKIQIPTNFFYLFILFWKTDPRRKMSAAKLKYTTPQIKKKKQTAARAKTKKKSWVGSVV